MKKIFSMMLLTAAVMVSAFTSCKSDDISTASMMTGSYTDNMAYAYTTPKKPLTPIESRKVTVNIIATEGDMVNIEIPEIKNLSFPADYDGTTVDVNVVDFAKFTITNVPVVEANGLIIASDMRKTDYQPTVTVSDLLKKYPHDYEVKDVSFNMIVNGREMSGKAVVSGQVIAVKADNKLTLIYDFYPAEVLKKMGISIGGVMGL